MRRSWAGLVAMIVVAGSATAAYLIDKNSRPSPADPVRPVRPERRVVRTTINATGTVRLKIGSEVRVGAQMSGIVKKLNVTVGSHVQAGDAIAEIDDRPIRARIADVAAQADLDRTSMEHSRVDYKRAQLLVSQGLVPSQQEEEAKLTLDEAEAKYQKSLRDLDLAKVDLSYVEIRAPIAGTIASVSTQEGETVAASFNTPTFVTVIADNALELVAMVDETDIASVQRGNGVSFTVDAYPSRDFPGTVESVAPKATIVSGVVNYEVTIEIRKDARLLKPDMTANVSIETAQREALFLPAAAVQKEGNESYVYVTEKDGPARHTVVAGASERGMVEIKKGLAPSDEILIVPPNAQAPIRK